MHMHSERIADQMGRDSLPHHSHHQLFPQQETRTKKQETSNKQHITAHSQWGPGGEGGEGGG